MRISEHTTILSTTIYTTGNQRAAGDVFSFTLMTVRITVLDSYLGLVDVGSEVDIRISSRIRQFTTTSTEDVAEVLRHGHW